MAVVTAGWAATNTLSDTVDELAAMCGENDADIADAYAALALVEAALHAAEQLSAPMRLNGLEAEQNETQRRRDALAAALRAVREDPHGGRVKSIGTDPANHAAETWWQRLRAVIEGRT